MKEETDMKRIKKTHRSSPGRTKKDCGQNAGKNIHKGRFGDLKSGNMLSLSETQSKLKKAVVGIFTLLLATAGFSYQAMQSREHEKIAQQVKEQISSIVSVDPATKPDDLFILKDIVKDTSIVLLGESQHRLREQYQLKHRIIKFLVEEMGFTHILIEDSFYGTIAIDDYIKGKEINPEKALQNIGGWYLWDTEEMLEFIKSMRAYNDTVKDEKKVSYIGMDIQDPWPGIRHLSDYFSAVDPEYSGYWESQKKVFEVFNKPIWIIINNSYPKLAPEIKQTIEDTLNETGERLNSHREKYIKSGGLKAFNDASLVVQHLLKSHEFFLWLETADEGEVGVREKTMFANVVRIKESAGPKAKIIVWAHNAHMAKSPVRYLNTSIPETVQLNLMGTMLKRKYGDDVKSIGMASLGLKNEKTEIGKSPDILDHVLAGTGLDLCFFDFQKLSVQNGNDNFLMAPWRLTADQGGYLSLVPFKAFDAMFFIKYTTIVRYSPESAKRFKTLF